MNRFTKDDLKTLIVVILVCTIFASIVLVVNIKSNSEKLEAVNEYNTFFSTTKYVNSYLNYLSNGDSQAVYNLLFDKYIEKYNITEDNVLSKLNKYPKDISIRVKQMEYVKVKDNYIYYINGKIIENGYDYEKVIDENFEIIVINDFNNLSVALYPINDTNYKKIIDNIKEINIVQNNTNHIVKSDLITKEQICIMYLSDYLNEIKTNIDYSYEILSQSMKKKYTTLDSYKKYINSQINNLTTVADKCKEEEIDKKRVYTVVDKNENVYSFTEESIMNYKVDLYFKEDKNEQ
ncbi:MAG: hypothetical protein ACI31S_01065 [Bacilli bacterium]